MGNAEGRRRELAQFLRSRREALTPEQAGVATQRRRRTPGLRREEVAFLADIGVKWYVRLELGDDVHPSDATLSGIAKALQLTPAETEYLFELARRPELEIVGRAQVPDIPRVFDDYVPSIRGVAVVLGNRYLTPFRWNAIAEAMFHYSRYPSALERNHIVRLLEPSRIAFVGAQFETNSRSAVGLLRMALASGEHDAHAQQIYERMKGVPLFKRFWEERAVVEEVTTPAAFVRHHDEVGTFSAFPLDLFVPRRKELLLRVLFPADEASAEKFARLEALGKPWSGDGTPARVVTREERRSRPRA